MNTHVFPPHIETMFFLTEVKEIRTLLHLFDCFFFLSKVVLMSRSYMLYMLAHINIAACSLTCH